MANDPNEVIYATSDAEEALIGAILIEADSQYLKDVMVILSHEDFHFANNRYIFQAMGNCPLPPDQINIGRQLRADSHLETGTIAHMSHCIAVCPCPLNYIDYAEAVKRYSELRTGIKRPRIKGVQL